MRVDWSKGIQPHKDCRPFLNGAEVAYAIEADDVEGWVRCYTPDGRGLARDFATGEPIVTMKTGSVRFVMKEDAATPPDRERPKCPSPSTPAPRNVIRGEFAQEVVGRGAE